MSCNSESTILTLFSKLTRPSISGSAGPIFWHEPPAIFEATRGNLNKLVKDLLTDGSTVAVTDPALPSANLSLVINFG